jgi:hypothetical protein
VLPGLFLLLFAVCQTSLAQSTKEGEVLAPGTVTRGDNMYQVTIADPFIELHTGPSAGYPIFHVVDRGARVNIIRRKTNWFRIETSDGVSGWVSREQMRQTLLPSGEQFKIVELDEADFAQRRWVYGVTGGEFESAPVFTFFGGYSFTENLAGEVHFGQSAGSDSSSTFIKGNLVMQPLPDLTWSPYMTLGVGKIKVSPSSLLIAPVDKINTFAQAGIGIQRFVSRSFLFRLEVNEYVIFAADSTRNNNEVVNEWKFGFAVFY